MKIKKTSPINRAIIAGLLFAGLLALSGIKQANALTFQIIPQFNFTSGLSGLSFFKKIQFSQNFSKIMLAENLTTIRFSPKLFRVNLMECEEAVNLCQQEFDACVGNIDQFDQAGYELLEKAKIQCQNSCKAPEKECFGIYENLEEPAPPPPPPPKQCTGDQTRACTTSLGTPGTQTAVSCNTATGEWNFGDCEPSTPTVGVPTNPCIEKYGPGSNYRTCTTAAGQPGEQHASYCDTTTEEWVWQECVALQVECQGSAPACPSGYSGSYICQNGQWVNQCQPPQSNCPNLESDWRVCQMPPDGLGVGRWGREYIDYCNESTGEWVWRPCNVYPNLQPTCTSFTYSDWSECSNNMQYRTIASREPYGCAGGNPVTSQSCELPTCLRFLYSDWSACVNGTQTRTVTGTYPEQCSGGNPILSQTCCSGAEPSCPSGWSGSYTCGNNTWYNTCLPPGPDYCYRGVKYRLYNGNAYASYVGQSTWNSAESCRNIIQSGSYSIWNDYNSENIFKSYVDQIYNGIIQESCDPGFVYTQC